MPIELVREAGFNPASIARKIKSANDAASRALRSHENDAVTSVLELLKKLDKELRREIASIDPEQFRSFHLARLQQMVSNLIADFSARAQTVASTSSITSMQLANQRFTDFLMLMKTLPGVSTNIVPVIPNEIFSVVSSMSAELVRGLASDLEKQVVSVLQRAVLGSRTPFEAAREISTIVGARGNVGAGAAADRIVRTEVNRAYNAADEQFNLNADERRPQDLPTLKKIWVATKDARTRPEHAKANGQTRDIDEPFRVGGEDLDYPVDPSGSPGNTINCRCTTITVPEELVDDMKSQIGA